MITALKEPIRHRGFFMEKGRDRPVSWFIDANGQGWMSDEYTSGLVRCTLEKYTAHAVDSAFLKRTGATFHIEAENHTLCRDQYIVEYVRDEDGYWNATIDQSQGVICVARGVDISEARLFVREALATHFMDSSKKRVKIVDRISSRRP